MNKTRYIYIFEDGQPYQSDSAPSGSDYVESTDGYMIILRVIGDSIDVNTKENVWVSVDERPIEDNSDDDDDDNDSDEPVQ
jgi:hypothetical protein